MEMEWLEAQKIEVSVDLLAAAKQHLQFLATVDRNRWLYEGIALQKAIYRYNAFWLPLLARHAESRITGGPLVVPLDCEWVWHCHRLNPVQYKSDCETVFGQILDNSNVASSVQGHCKKETEAIWSRLYPQEPYDFRLAGEVSEDSVKTSRLENCSTYDFVSSVKRQSPFFHQVSGRHMNNDVYLQEAIARYKGFLHLINTNRKRSIKCFCVPTYDIDLIWHTHQLHPVSYCKDLTELLGKVLEHDDMDSDRTKGKKLDVGFSGTTKQYEEAFGRRYWRAGAMYKGSAPSPLEVTPFPLNVDKNVVASNESQKLIQLQESKFVEAFLEIVGVKNLPEGHEGSLSVSFSKAQPDKFFTNKQKLSIQSVSGVKQVASFQCEPSGELLFELMSHSSSSLPITSESELLGSTLLSLRDFVTPIFKLSDERWLELAPSYGTASAKPISIHVAVSFTIPCMAPHVLHMVRPRALSKSWTRVVYEAGSEVVSLQFRDNAKARDDGIAKKEVIATTKRGEIRTLAECVSSGWSLMDSCWSLRLAEKLTEDGHVFDLIGNRTIKFFIGRKLDYEAKHSEKRGNEQDFMTAVEFSAADPYGKAKALLNLKSGILKVNEEWLVLPVITSAFIISGTLKNEGLNGLAVNGDNVKTINSVVSQEEVNSKENEVMVEKSGGCGGGGCGSIVKSGGCGGCGGGGCGSMVESGGCGGGCGGGGCGSIVSSGGCGGCGSGCGGCGGGGCGSMVKSGGCGGGGGCGSMAMVAEQTNEAIAVA